MAYRLAALLACVLTLTSCVVTYRDFPAVGLESDPPPKTGVPCSSYHVVPLATPIEVRYFLTTLAFLEPWFWDLYVLWPTEFADRKLSALFEERHASPAAVPTNRSPAKGVHCVAKVDHQPMASSSNHIAYGFLHLVTLTLLPYYSNGVPYHVTYELHVDGEVRRQYRYAVTKSGVAGILVLPFAWLNLFTYSETEALRATFYQFLIDAERDGYPAQESSPMPRTRGNIE